MFFLPLISLPSSVSSRAFFHLAAEQKCGRQVADRRRLSDGALSLPSTGVTGLGLPSLARINLRLIAILHLRNETMPVENQETFKHTHPRFIMKTPTSFIDFFSTEFKVSCGRRSYVFGVEGIEQRKEDKQSGSRCRPPKPTILCLSQNFTRVVNKISSVAAGTSCAPMKATFLRVLDLSCPQTRASDQLELAQYS